MSLELIAGSIGGAGNLDGAGAAARFSSPIGLAVDGAGNVYVADSGNHRIRKVAADGGVSTLAMLPDEAMPTGVAVDRAGNIYVADQTGPTIDRITATGSLSTLAGLRGASGAVDGTGAAARFFEPRSLVIDDSGDLLVGDAGGMIRKVTPAGVVTTLAGSSDTSRSADGIGPQARFVSPLAVALAPDGTLVVADTHGATIRAVTAAGAVTTIAGQPEVRGDVDGPAADALFNDPLGVAVDGAGNIFVADYASQTIREIAPAGIVSTFAGAVGALGAADGRAGAARFDQPSGLAFDTAGNLYVAEAGNEEIRKIGPQGQVTTLAGSSFRLGSVDGQGAQAEFGLPAAAALDGAGNVYVADSANNTVRRVQRDGTVTTLAGSPGQRGSADGIGAAARFANPSGIAVDGAGNVYVADTANQTIRMIAPSGAVTTLAGTAEQVGSSDGAGAAARFDWPLGLAVDTQGNVYVADSHSETIRKIAPGGAVTTVAGVADHDGFADGRAAVARFAWPAAVAVDRSGNVYVADTANSAIRKLDTRGLVSTIARDLHHPQGLAVDDAGNVYVADTAAAVIRQVSPGGAVTALAGAPDRVGIVLGMTPGFTAPAAVAVAGDALVVVDTNAILLLQHGAQ